MTNLTNAEAQISTLKEMKRLLLSCGISNQNDEIKNIESNIKSIIKQIRISQNITEQLEAKQSQKFIDAIQKMCSEIEAIHPIITGFYPERDFGLSDFQKILALCDDSECGDSERKKLFVLYCYVVAYACKFAEHESWVANYVENQRGVLRSPDVIYFCNKTSDEEEQIVATKYIPKNALLMLDELYKAYNEAFRHPSDITSIITVPITKDSESSEKIVDYAKFFCDFRHAMRFSDPSGRCLPLFIDHLGPHIYPTNILYGTCPYTESEVETIRTFLLYPALW